MSEDLNRDFSRYDTMTTEDLEELLRLDADAPAGAESDTQSVLYILEVLERRTRADRTTGDRAKKAWESFQRNYMPEESRKPARTRGAAFWGRKLTAAAAAVVLLIFIPVSIHAFGVEHAWNVFARWAKETFCFVDDPQAEISAPVPEDQQVYASLQEMLLENNRDPSVVPTWVPEGFEQGVLERSSTPVQEVYTAVYQNGNRTLRIQVRNHLSGDVQNYEIEDAPVEIYLHEGIEYYIFTNVTQVQTIWLMDSYECHICGDISVGELKGMIDSIP